MEIYLIRHTETAVGKDICYGQSDVSLKQPFWGKFARISAQITEKSFMIYSSPLRRCAILSEYLQQFGTNIGPVKYDNRLKEMNFGTWEFKKWDEIDTGLFNIWAGDYVNNGVPGGESFKQLYLRVIDFIESELLPGQHKLPVVIVSHAGVIRSILCYAGNIPLTDAFDLSVPFGSVLKTAIPEKE